MAPANPLPLDPIEATSLATDVLATDPRLSDVAGTDVLGTDVLGSDSPDTQPVSRQELNAWRRGFTPQAEIWNGRLAMLGLSVGLSVLLLVRLAGG
ncbi:MAG: high light inducible protein [Cyanobium sp. CACIAM 14]|nr:MAG: high light inducible protein [Cyanobium sp. CACIAM 14]